MDVGWLKEYETVVTLSMDWAAYNLDPIKEKFEVVNIPDTDHYLVLNKKEGWLKFCLLNFLTSRGDNTDVKCSLVFHGEGPGDNEEFSLRECRHTWWGDENGYVFYPHGNAISGAFKILSEYYDEMV